MDQKYNTSFIPKKFLSENVQGSTADRYVKRRGVVGPGYFISVLLFVATIAASVGLFVYIKIINDSVRETVSLIEAQMEELKKEDLAQLAQLEKQMDVTQDLLDGHVAVTELLHTLEKKTLQDVRYISLAFMRNADPEPASVDLNAKTGTLALVASQAREFEAESNLVESSLRTLGTDDAGLYTFGMRSTISSNLISYSIAVREGRHGKQTNVAPPAVSSNPVVVSPGQ